jgi:hypothetical protein
LFEAMTVCNVLDFYMKVAEIYAAELTQSNIVVYIGVGSRSCAFGCDEISRTVMLKKQSSIRYYAVAANNLPRPPMWDPTLWSWLGRLPPLQYTWCSFVA